MDNFWDEIPVPTEAEKDAAVCQILDAGLPARPGLWHTLTETFQAVGLRTLFFGAADCLFLAVLFLVLCRRQPRQPGRDLWARYCFCCPRHCTPPCIC